MGKNNFQQLQEELEHSISPHQYNQIQRIEKGVGRSLRFFRIIGSVVYMYLPGFARTVVGSPSPHHSDDYSTSSEAISERNDPASFKQGDWNENDPR